MRYIALFLMLAMPALGQTSDRWRELVIDEATPEQAAERLGKPRSDKRVGKGEMEMRVLHWERTEGFDDVKLYFKDGTLAMIYLDGPREKIAAKDFVAAYKDAEFEVGRGANSAVYYELEAITEKTRISAGVGNVTGSFARQLFGVRGQLGRLPRLEGNVRLIFIRSRRLDDGRSINALK